MKKMKNGKLRIGRLLVTFLTICFLTIVSWLFAFAKDEGQIDEKTEWIKNLIADSFNFFRFPVHTLFEPWIISDGIAWYFPGLMLNVVILTFLIERLLSIGINVCQLMKDKIRDDKFACPCCGYMTLRERPRGTYTICQVCFWEDDPVQLKDPDCEGGANRVSLRQGQKNFQDFRACERDMIKNVRPPNIDEFRDKEWKFLD
jgi:hypothetical protein